METKEDFLKRMNDDNQRMKKTLKNHKCLYCLYLTYWDGYYCTLGKHQTKKGFLNMHPYKECNDFTKRSVDWFWGLKESDLDIMFPE